MKHKKLIGILAILFFLTPSLKVLAEEDSKTVNAELYWGEKMIEEELKEGLTHNFKGSFLSAEGMMPGDVVERSMVLKNTYKYPYTITLTGSRKLEYIDKEYDLLEKINLDLTVIDSNGKENKVYSGPMFDGNKVKVNIQLCTLDPNKEATLKAVATLDGKSTTKEYMGRRASVNWIFRVEGDDKTIKPEDKDPNPNHPDNPDHPDTPNYPDTPDHPDNPGSSDKPKPLDNPGYPDDSTSQNIYTDFGGNKPLSLFSDYDNSSSSFTSFAKGLVKTGDSANIVVILILAAGSLLIGTLLFKKKKVNKED